MTQKTFFDERKLCDSLERFHYLSKEEIGKAKKEAGEQKKPLDQYLLDTGLLSKDLLGQAIAEFFKVDYADLNSILPSHEQILKIPEKQAVQFNAVLFEEKKDEVIIATDNPVQEKLKEAMQEIFQGKKIKINYSLFEDIEPLLKNYREKLESRFVKIINEQKRVAPEIIDEIVKDALFLNASDIHFEPEDGDKVLIRFRIDGVLQPAGRIAGNYYLNILNRLKVQAHLRIDEHQTAQDGAIKWFDQMGEETNLRVSILPTLEGEKVVMRLTSKRLHRLDLISLGLSKNDQKIIKECAQKPFGMLLVTGPTGSGKTTTLYALLNLINHPGINVTTIEDPVEFRISGVNQIQVNTGAGLTFAKGLRSIVRQDPDVILVGEIRDQETSEIAVNAALTGHLLLSTFHANDAAASIPRLLDMNVEPFLLASTLELIIAQRLARRICENCRYSLHPTTEELKKIPAQLSDEINEKTTIYQGKGCSVCNFTGYLGRVGLFELIKVTPTIEELIMKNPSSQEIFKEIKKSGGKFIFEDGLEKVKSGMTTLLEVFRVAPPRS